MKTKKIPKVVKAWVGLLGFYMGMMVTLIIGCVNVFNSDLGFYAFLAMLVISVVSGWILLQFKRETLVEWSLLEPKKKKEK